MSGFQCTKNIFVKGYAPSWSEEIFVVKKNKKYCTSDMSLVI